MAYDGAGTQTRTEFDPYEKIIATLRCFRVFDDDIRQIAGYLCGLKTMTGKQNH